MIVRSCCSKVAACKAVQTLVLLLLCIVVIFFIVIVIESIEKTEESKGKNEKFEIAPNPNPAIHYSVKRSKSLKRMFDKVHDFLKEYKLESRKYNKQECFFNETLTKRGNVCLLDVDKMFGPCVEEQSFGYPRGTPCVFIKFKKFLNWTPEKYDLGQLNETSLSSSYISFIEKEVSKKGADVLNMVFCECRGKTPYDITLLGEVDYYPWNGFPGFLFPYKGEEKYLEPLIAIHAKNARIGVIIDIECEFKAKNFDEKLSFSLLVDDNKP